MQSNKPFSYHAPAPAVRAEISHKSVDLATNTHTMHTAVCVCLAAIDAHRIDKFSLSAPFCCLLFQSVFYDVFLGARELAFLIFFLFAWAGGG